MQGSCQLVQNQFPEKGKKNMLIFIYLIKVVQIKGGKLHSILSVLEIDLIAQNLSLQLLHGKAYSSLPLNFLTRKAYGFS